MFAADVVVDEIPLDLVDGRIQALGWLFSPLGRTNAFTCVFDTGSKRTLIPQRIWRNNEHLIQFEPGNFTASVVGIGGNPIPSRLGRCGVRITNSKCSATATYPRCQMLFLLDADAVFEGQIARAVPYVLIGLGDEFSGGGGICLNMRDKKASLVDLGKVQTNEKST